MTSRTPRFRWLFGAFALIVATAFVTTQVVSQDHPGQPPKMSPEEQKMFDACMKAATPGPQHKQLASIAGTWDVATKFWMKHDAPASESKSVSKAKTILGDRWIMEEFEGQMDQMPFEGMGITGFDNVKKKYVNFWMDTMGTGAMISEGTADASGKVVTYIGTYEDPMTNKTKTYRSISKIVSDSKRTFEMYDTTPEGKEFKNLDIVYTRK